MLGESITGSATNDSGKVTDPVVSAMARLTVPVCEAM
jgi:hypothetical protein